MDILHEERMQQLNQEWSSRNEHSLSDYSYGSNKKVWWKCEKNHEWVAMIRNRYKGANCPYCAGKRVISGENDLATMFPQIAKEWDYWKNEEKPTEIRPHSRKIVGWICEKGHTWDASVLSRVQGSRCPVCRKRQIECDDGIKYEIIRQEGYLSCRCLQSHRWKQPLWITNSKIRCPMCALRDYSDMKQYIQGNERLYKSLDCNINELEGVPIENVYHRYTWKCEKGHKWQAAPIVRWLGYDCPICADIVALKGYNDLATTHPQLASEFVECEQDNIKLDEITYKSNILIKWKCKEGHKWTANLKDRVQKGTGCPYCSGRLAIEGVNDLATVNPALAREYSSENEIPITMIKPYSHKKVIWNCTECGNTWVASVYNRSNGSKCPACLGLRAE